MSTSDAIRSLAREGVRVAEIARRLGIRYQHAYKVIRDAGMLADMRPNAVRGPARAVRPTRPKPRLPVETLRLAGFRHSGCWLLSEDNALVPDRPLPKEPGVYGFARDEHVLYIGLATMGLAKRLYFYGRPGRTQRTSSRVNALLKGELRTVQSIDIYTAVPPDFEWNGLPVSGSAGLELGLIERFLLPWNIRGVRP